LLCGVQGRAGDEAGCLAEIAARYKRRLPKQRFHDLRHGFATLLLDRDTPLSAVMDLLGHSSISVTVNIYGHVLDEAKRRAMAAITEVYRDGTTG
jgi:integrase